MGGRRPFSSSLLGSRQTEGSQAARGLGGALVHGLLGGWPLERTIRLANAAGSFVAGQLLCSDAMPTLADLEPALEEVRS